MAARQGLWGPLHHLVEQHLVEQHLAGSHLEYLEPQCPGVVWHQEYLEQQCPEAVWYQEQYPPAHRAAQWVQQCQGLPLAWLLQGAVGQSAR